MEENESKNNEADKKETMKEVIKENTNKEVLNKEKVDNEIKNKEGAVVLNPDIAEKALKKMNKNPWMLASIVLSVLLIIALFNSFGGGGISEDKAGQIILDFANSQTGGGVELVNVSEVSGLYEVSVLYQGQSIPLYITKDGKTLVQGVMPLEVVGETPQSPQSPQQAPSAEPVKTERPQVDLFIWGYCPYGVTAQGPMAEVASLLGDSADFRAVMYYDGHGPFETQENKIQACIQKLEKAKYWDYAAKFVSDVYPVCSQTRDVECDKTESTKVMDAVGIDSDAVFECVESEGADLIAADAAYARENAVTGSPTVVVNGVKANVARTADAYKGVVCDSFLESPEACGDTLSTDAATTSGSC